MKWNVKNMKWSVDKKNLKKGAVIAGGIALVVGASAVCIKGLKAVDKHMKAKKEAEDFAENCDVVIVEEDPVEETAVEEVAVEEILAEEAAAEETAEEEKPAE